MILALETSCDDTCAAVMTAEGELRANIVSSQLDHREFGGVVPEIAARAHLQLINPVIDRALIEARSELDAIELVAVTQGPGLIGALLIGVATAKAIAAARQLPLVAVDHLHGHIASNFIGPRPLQLPAVCLIVSGGHTLLVRVVDPANYEVIGTTLDDAAGEAFDKGARLLGLPYPGGAPLSQLAATGDAHAFDFPTARALTELDFSFAGLKTALLYKVRELGSAETERRRQDLAASYQRAIVEALMVRIRRALRRYPNDRFALCGGVAANRRLRDEVRALCPDASIPDAQLCTDNAAMIASAARWAPPIAYPRYLELDAYPARAVCV